MNVAGKGIFLVLYGPNATGKSTQKYMLLETFRKSGLKAEGLKYPIYESVSGQKINNIIRSGKKQKMSEYELQMLYTDNRAEYEPILKGKLDSGINVIAEDYVGTGLAWAITKGMKENSDEYMHLECLNSFLLHEDIAFLFDGDPFKNALEENHIHESNLKFMEKSREVHRQLGEKYGWIKINSMESKEVVHETIVNELRRKFGIL